MGTQRSPILRYASKAVLPVMFRIHQYNILAITVPFFV